jgi:hypothetical protein
MTQAISTLEGKSYLSITGKKESGKNSKRKKSNFDLDENTIFRAFSVFYYGNNARMSFSISDNTKTHYGLLKGLIEFYRSKQLQFHFIKEENEIQIDVNVELLENVHNLISLVSKKIQEELAFKRTLKNVIAFEAIYKSEKAKAYERFGINALISGM